MTPVVSIVIPTYNRARDLARAVKSLLAQDFTSWEALIVDNHSSDDTSDVVRRFNDGRLRYQIVSNGGVIAVSRNLGIAQAQGEFVAFLDSDDWWAKDKLSRAVESLRGGADVSYHDMRIVSTRFRLGARTFSTRQLQSPVYDDLLVNGNTIPTSSVVVRASLLRQTRGFDEDPAMIAVEDYALWLQLAKLSERFSRLEGTLGFLQRGDDNMSGSKRLIGILSLLEQRYLGALAPAKRAAANARWLDYAYGRAQYEQKRYDLARDHLVRVFRHAPRPSFRLKALYMLLMIAAHRGGTS